MAGTDGMLVEPPLVIADPDAQAWDDVADVVVVGFGGAGAAAALQARESGADVLAIDRFEGGGATAYSGGIIYSGGNTTIQRDAGVTDDVEEMVRYLALEVGNTVSSATVRRYCEESSETIDWLIGHGVPYEGSLFSDKTAYPPDGYHLYYSGNEQVAGFKENAKPAARGHRAVGPGMTGQVMFDALRKSAEAHGVRRLSHAPVTQLVTDPSGTVIGVVVNALDQNGARRHQDQYKRVVPMLPFKNGTIEDARRKSAEIERASGQRRMIRARAGVVLSTGGFVNNLDMMKRHTPLLATNYRSSLRLGSLGCDGSGIQLGQSAGGDVARLDHMLIARNLAPPMALLSGILVNSRGERFINEGTYSGFMGQAITEQPDATAWLLVDAAILREALKQIVTGGWTLFMFSGPQLLNILAGGTKRGRTLEKLAAKCGIDPAGLKATIEGYNQACAAGRDPLGKSKDYLRPLERPSYYAINQSIWARMGFTMLFSLGGLKVEEDTGEVLDTGGQPIRQLYAAGRTALGLCSHSYISGLSIGDAVFSGRRAARHIAGRLER